MLSMSWQCIMSPRASLALVQQSNGNGLTTLLGLYDLHRHAFSFFKSAHPRAVENRSVNENVLFAIAGRDKAKSLVGVVPLDGSLDADRGRRIRTRPAGRSSRWRPRVLPGLRHPGFDGKDRGNLAPFLTSADLDAEFGAGLNALMPSRLQHGDVQKNIARAIGQLSEAKPLLRVEPLDDGVKRRPARDGFFSGYSPEWLARGAVV